MRWLIFTCMILCLLALSGAEACDLSVSLLNQDPFPAVPGDIVELVFVIDGIDSIECGTVSFDVQNDYPFAVMPYEETTYSFESGTFLKDYNSQKLIPIDFKVSEDAIDGSTPIEVHYSASSSPDSRLSKSFDIDIQDVRATFEVFVSEYDYSTQELKFEILNTGKSDIEAVTVTVPAQDGISIIGANKNNIGDLSSNEDTSADFSATITGDSIDLLISYSDAINERRSVAVSVPFVSSQFSSTASSDGSSSYYWIIAIVAIVAFFWWRRRRHRKHMKRN